MTKRLGIAEALREAIGEEMERDPRGVLHRRGHRGARRMGRRLHRDPGPGETLPRADDQHAHRRTGLLRRRLRRGDDGHAPHRRRPIRRLPPAGHRPDRQQHRQDARHVRRAGQGAPGHAGPGRRHRPRQPARAERRTLSCRRAGDQDGRGFQRLRRQGPSQGRRPRRQPRDDLSSTSSYTARRGSGPRAPRSMPPATFPAKTTSCRWTPPLSAARAPT